MANYEVTTPDGVDKFTSDSTPKVKDGHLMFIYFSELRIIYPPGTWRKFESVPYRG